MPLDFAKEAIENADRNSINFDELRAGKANIKVFGMGGCGCNMATWLFNKGINGATIYGVNTDALHLSITKCDEKILIAVSNPETVDELIHLSTLIKSEKNKKGLFALSIINNNSLEADSGKQAKKILEKAAITASSTDVQLTQLLRYDLNIVNGITSVIREHNITDLVLGLYVKKGISESFLGNLTEGILEKSNTTTLVYKPAQPISTIKRYFIVMPANTEKEVGCPFWLPKIWNISKNTGAKLLFYGTEPTLQVIRSINSRHPVDAEFNLFDDWNNFLLISRDIRIDDNLIVILSRKNKISYQSNMINVPDYLNKYFRGNNYILIYPIQTGVGNIKRFDLNNPSLLEPIEKLDEIGKTILNIINSKR